MRQFVPHVRGLVVAVLALGFVAEVQAAVPLRILLQRRGSRSGGRSMIPTKPSPVDSSPTIDTLNKALKALGATDRDYNGHREKAIHHIGVAIHHMEMPTGRGRSNAAIQQAAVGKAAVATKTATTPQAASDASLRKAKAILFSVHHELVEHTATRGHIRADADVRIAITEIVEALKTSTTPPAAASSKTTSTNATAPIPIR